MNVYSRFVNDSFSVISEILPAEGNKLLSFAYGEKKRVGTNEIESLSDQTNEFAFLNDNKALMFYALLVSNAGTFGIDPSGLFLSRSRIDPDNISIDHCCYSKNLRRWMNGQKSRKALNRAEYVVLLYCWAIDWYGNGYHDRAHKVCRKKLTALCTTILGDDDTSRDLLTLLWSASHRSYTEAYAAAYSD